MPEFGPGSNFENPKGEDADFEFEDEEMYATKYKKVVSSGSDWLERRSEARMFQRDDESKSVLGKNLFMYKDSINSDSKNSDEFSKDRIAIAEERYQNELKRLRRSLLTLTLKAPKELQWSFDNYVGPENIKNIIEKLKISNYQIDKAKKYLTNKGQLRHNAILYSDNKPLVKKLLAVSEILANMADEIPEDILLDWLEEHHRLVEEENEKILSEYKERYPALLAQLEEAIDTGLLPITKAFLRERLDNINVVVIDSLSARLRNVEGDYSADYHQLRVDYSVSKDDLDSVYMHEFLHALSGNIETQDENLKYDTNISKVGLAASSQYGNDQKKFNLRWLNEAMTEDLASQVRKVEPRAYQNYIKLMKELVSRGINYELIKDAYFESYQNTPSGEHSTPKYKELINLMNEKFGPGFIHKLNISVNFDNGKNIPNLISAWEQYGDDFPKYLETLQNND